MRTHGLEKSDIIKALEIAKAALEHEIMSDMIGDEVDLSEVEMDRLHGLLVTYLEDK